MPCKPGIAGSSPGFSIKPLSVEPSGVPIHMEHFVALLNSKLKCPNCDDGGGVSLLSFPIALLNKLIETMTGRSGSVEECLTRDRFVAGSSFTGVTALCI